MKKRKLTLEERFAMGGSVRNSKLTDAMLRQREYKKGIKFGSLQKKAKEYGGGDSLKYDQYGVAVMGLYPLVRISAKKKARGATQYSRIRKHV